MNYSKIAVIGAGAVGATTAYALLLKNIAAEIILVDIDQVRCKGEIYDLSDALPFCGPSKIRGGTAKDAAQANIVVIAAGAKQKPGQSRLELIETNSNIVRTILEQIKPFNEHAILIIVTNPVDLMTICAQDFSGLPRSRVFGSGTYLDTQRLRGLISKEIGIAEQSIDALILGEHGDTQFPAWSSANIDGVPMSYFPQLTQKKLDQITHETRKKAYDIIECKGATFYGIATCVASMCEAILFDQKLLIPLSVYIEKFDVCLSMPTVLGCNGIEQILELPLNKVEQEKLKASARELLSLKNKCSF